MIQLDILDQLVVMDALDLAVKVWNEKAEALRAKTPFTAATDSVLKTRECMVKDAARIKELFARADEVTVR